MTRTKQSQEFTGLATRTSERGLYQVLIIFSRNFLIILSGFLIFFSPSSKIQWLLCNIPDSFITLLIKFSCRVNTFLIYTLLHSTVFNWRIRIRLINLSNWSTDGYLVMKFWPLFFLSLHFARSLYLFHAANHHTGHFGCCGVVLCKRHGVLCVCTDLQLRLNHRRLVYLC